jgi:hypothetical protein
MSINYQNVYVNFDTDYVFLPDATAQEIIQEVKRGQDQGMFFYGISTVDGEFNIHNDQIIMIR